MSWLPGRVRVLVVDDEPAICKVLTIALERAGYAVCALESPEAAHLLLRQTRVDVLVADLRMAEMRGDVLYHLAESIQPDLRSRTLFCTGDITDRGAALIGECRCPVLRKPFELSDLMDAVRALSPHLQSASA